jgi:hypothetical protein
MHGKNEKIETNSKEISYKWKKRVLRKLNSEYSSFIKALENKDNKW